MASSEAAASIISNPLLFTNTNLQLQAAEHEHEQQASVPPPSKKKRSLPGTPDPAAEVIALSPTTLLATNRFVCEICGKGFQRDQNLQLHRRGHNLPWKLRQRSGGNRKRVYVCPERSCVHHSPARALGDLTGIKKHFCRKHGEKKWKCERCSKRYAVQSDWKAHAKTCGTREYRCDCGTRFSRRDSFITHRAFCDALAEETARLNAATSSLFGNNMPPPLPPAAGQLLGGGLSLWGGNTNTLPSSMNTPVVLPQLYADLFAPPPQLGWLYDGNAKLSSSSNASELTTEADCSLPSVLISGHAKPAATTDDMSATALLHKAAQMASGDAMPAGQTLLACYDVSSALRHAGAGLNLKDAVGNREGTRDFLGVGVQPLMCSSPSLPLLRGWI